MAGAPSQKMDLSDGELTDDDGGPEEDLDTSICKTCNLTFTNSKAFYHHIYSVSHLQKTSNLSNASEPATSDATTAAKSSFPMDALYVSKPILPFQKAAYFVDYEAQSYHARYPDPILCEPLLEGQWIMADKKSEKSRMIYSCETCGVSYKEQLMINLHLAGLRHQKNIEAAEVESRIVDDRCQRMNLNDIVERNVDLFKQLNRPPELEQSQEDVTHGDYVTSSSQWVEQKDDLLRPISGSGSEVVEVQDKKMNVADILSRNVNAFQQLSVYVEPVLGVDYISEFRFSDGHVEHVCNLCELSLTVPVSLTEHASSLKHLLRFIFYHDSSSFKLISLADKCADLEFVQNVAADIECKQGRQLRTRVFVETTAAPPGQEDVTHGDSVTSSSQWVEQKDDLLRPISALPGHAANASYSYQRPPDDTTQASDVQSLLDMLTSQSCAASNKPPSVVKPVSRMDLLSSLAVFNISSDSDAEVSLQVANALTLALLHYRIKVLPMLKPNDRTKLEPKVVKLREEAELVADKTRGRSATIHQDSVLP